MRKFFLKSCFANYFIVLFVFTLTEIQAKAQSDAFRSTSLPMPRYVSLAVDEVNMRTGPGKQFPVKWVYQRKGLPVEIILEFDNWRKIRDHEGEEGWVHHSLLSGKRTVVIAAGQRVNLLRDPRIDAPAVAYLDSGVVPVLDDCREEFCNLEIKGYSGWVERKYIWGVYADEKFD